MWNLKNTLWGGGNTPYDFINKRYIYGLEGSWKGKTMTAYTAIVEGVSTGNTLAVTLAIGNIKKRKVRVNSFILMGEEKEMPCQRGGKTLLSEKNLKVTGAQPLST